MVSVFPWIRRLKIFLDNATDTKSWYLFGWAMEMVSTGKVDSIHISFLIAGHTKFPPHRLFASIANAYKKADVFTIEEMQALCTPFAVTLTEDGTHILTWRDSLGQKYTKLPGVRNLHDFVFVKESSGKVLTVVRDFWFGGTWKESPPHPKQPNISGIPTCTYKDKHWHPIKADKMEPMITVYNRCPTYLPPTYLPPCLNKSSNTCSPASHQGALLAWTHRLLVLPLRSRHHERRASAPFLVLKE